MTESWLQAPTPGLLRISAALVGLQGLFFLGYAVLEFWHISGTRLAMGLTTGAFFAVYGALLLACAFAFTHRGGWARSPVVLTQGIAILVAWGFRGGDTTVVAAVVVAIAIVILVGVFAPSSRDAFDA